MFCFALGQVFAQSSGEGNPGSGNDNSGGTGGAIGGLNGDGPKQMELEGETEVDLPRSLLLPFEAFISREEVIINSLSSLSDVTVQVVSNDGSIMFNVTRDFDFLQQINISLIGYPSGTYTLMLFTPRGTFIRGEFIY